MSPLEYGDLIDSPAEGMMTTQEPAGAWHLGGGWDVQLNCSTYNSMQNFITLGQPLLGEKYVAQKKEK